MTKPFTGKHMAAVLVAGFGIVIAVNLTMAAFATSTFGGLVVENSYVASQQYNGWLEEAREAKALGWQASLSRQPDGRILIATQGAPPDIRASGDAWHPLGRAPDRPLQFEPAGGGTFLSTTPLPEGRWLIRLELSRGSTIWRSEQALP